MFLIMNGILRSTEGQSALPHPSTTMPLMSSAREDHCGPLLSALDRYDHELADLAYALAHDLRAPLRTIDGFSQALSEDYADRLDDDGRSDLARIRSAAAQMENMITAVSELARVGRTAITRTPVDASEIALTIAARLKESEPARRVLFDIEPDVVVDADRDLLTTALNELLANAWKFTAGRDEATIAFSRRATEDGEELLVRDDGAGFAPAHRSRMFIPFQRLHSQKEFPGRGLGLAIVRRIAHRHLGSVDAEGSIGGGATFFLRLGRAVVPVQKEEP